MARYNVTVIRPIGFLHSSAFREVQQSLGWSLSELGHDVMESENQIVEDRVNIVMGCELLGPKSELPQGTIIYSLEQPSHPNLPIVKQLARNMTVWDYSKRNCEQWKSEGYDCYHVPIGFTPNLVRIPKSDHYDWDCAFFGFMTPRRVKIIDELRRSEHYRKGGLRVFASDSCYGGARDSVISRSEIVLNLHHDGRDMFEIARVSYLLANGVAVVTEYSSDEDEYRDLIDEFGNYTNGAVEKTDNVVVTVEHLLDSVNGELPYLRDEGKRLFMKRDFTSTLRSTLLEMRYRSGCRAGDMADFLPWLREYAAGNIIEIGVRDGASTSAFLLGIQEHGGHLWSIDVQDCSAVARGHAQWTFIHENSMKARTVSKQLPYECDLLLIDGDHSRPGFMNDFTQYSPRVRPGGMIVCHDIEPEPTNWVGEDVKQCYRELVEKTGWRHEELPGKYGMGVLYKP